MKKTKTYQKFTRANLEKTCRDAQQALQESEEKYRQIVSNSVDGVVIVRGLTISYLNSAALNIFGYSEKDLIGKSFLTLVHPEHKHMIKARAFRRLKGIKTPKRYIFKGIRKDRTQIFIEVSTDDSFLYKGKPTILAVLRDISESKRFQDKLDKISNCFFSLNSSSSDNIDKLVALCGDLMNATCALYNKLDNKMLCTFGKWNAPEGYNPLSPASGHICYDVIRRTGDKITVIQDLQKTRYAKTDPNVKRYKLNTYMGVGVQFAQLYIGALCVVFKDKYMPTEEDKKLMRIIASAIASEEERSSAEVSLKESHKRYMSIFEDSPISLWEEDFSNVKIKVDDLKKRGIKDLRSYIMDNPEFISECVSSIKIIDINKATLKLYAARTKKEFWQGITRVFVEESYKAVAEQIIAIAKGRMSFEAETVNQTLLGETKNIHLRWSVVPGYERTYAKVLVSVMDISRRKTAENEVRNSEENFRNLADNSPNMIFIVCNNKIVYVNEKCVEIMKYPREVFLSHGFTFMKLLAPKSRDAARRAFLKHSNNEEVPPAEYSLLTSDGNILETVIATRVIRFNGCNAILGIITDMNDFVQMKNELKIEKDRVETYLNLVGAIVVALDVEGRVSLINKYGADALGYEPSEIIGKKWMDMFILPGERNKVEKAFRSLLKGNIDKHHYFENAIITKKQGERLISWRNTYIKNEFGKVMTILSAGTDITDHFRAEREKELLNKELSQSNKKLRHLALRDPLTGLYNHKFLRDAIGFEFSRARRYAHTLGIIMIDIDYFKSVNELYGCEFGDRVIVQIAQQIKKSVRPYDIVIRYGGEEFVVIAPGADRAFAVRLSERIMSNINLYNFGNSSHKIKVNISVGVASYPEDRVSNGMELLSFADKIMDKAKEEGGNIVVSSMDLVKGLGTGIAIRDEKGDVKLLRNQINKLNKRSKQSIVESIFAFAKTIELRDHYTGEHVENTVKYARLIAEALDVQKEDAELIKQAAMLHDLGKVGISDRILHKRGKLTSREYDEIKKHPQIAADIIRPIQLLHDVLPLIYYHHERWDGKGYPTGLKGEEIPIGARIISVADAYQALSSDRPYRKAFPPDKVVKILKEESGTKYDPSVIKVFLKVLSETEERSRNKTLSEI